MIIGSGLLAKAFSRVSSQLDKVCIYAAGVSNSNCIDLQAFDRERGRLSSAIENLGNEITFVYFGTCSVLDPEMTNKPYVMHKLAMEEIVKKHPKYLILRLPQVAGKTTNPNTLLNFLFARISCGETFKVWSKAKRNIIDVDDVVSIAMLLLADSSLRNITVNIANTSSYSLIEIVNTFEKILEKSAIYEIEERGADYYIDTKCIYPLLEKAGINFSEDYLKKVIKKYYKII